MIKTIAAFIGAVVAAYIIGTSLNSISTLLAYNIDIPISEYVHTVIFDIQGMWLYAVIIALAFIIAFPIAWLLIQRAPSLGGSGYPIAGTFAILSALGLMYMQFETVPISGARSLPGLVVQSIAGALGGFIFSRFNK